MKRIKNFFLKQKLIKEEMAKLIRRNEYLELKVERLKAEEKGYFELIKIYDAVILYLGERLLKSEGTFPDDYQERVGELLKQLIKI